MAEDERTSPPAEEKAGGDAPAKQGIVEQIKKHKVEAIGAIAGVGALAFLYINSKNSATTAAVTPTTSTIAQPAQGIASAGGTNDYGLSSQISNLGNMVNNLTNQQMLGESQTLTQLQANDANTTAAASAAATSAAKGSTSYLPTTQANAIANLPRGTSLYTMQNGQAIGIPDWTTAQNDFAGNQPVYYSQSSIPNK